MTLDNEIDITIVDDEVYFLWDGGFYDYAYEYVDSPTSWTVADLIEEINPSDQITESEWNCNIPTALRDEIHNLVEEWQWRNDERKDFTDAFENNYMGTKAQ